MVAKTCCFKVNLKTAVLIICIIEMLWGVYYTSERLGETISGVYYTQEAPLTPAGTIGSLNAATGVIGFLIAMGGILGVIVFIPPLL